MLFVSIPVSFAFVRGSTPTGRPRFWARQTVILRTEKRKVGSSILPLTTVTHGRRSALSLGRELSLSACQGSQKGKVARPGELLHQTPGELRECRHQAFTAIPCRV